MEEEKKKINQRTMDSKKVFKGPIAKKIRAKRSPFEQTNDIEKLALNFVVVNEGVGDAIITLLRNLGCSMSFVNVAKGSAPKALLEVLGVSNSTKEMVCTFVKISQLNEIEKELAAFFLANKKNQGISFSTPLSSIAGVRLYKFLTQTL